MATAPVTWEERQFQEILSSIGELKRHLNRAIVYTAAFKNHVKKAKEELLMQSSCMSR